MTVKVFTRKRKFKFLWPLLLPLVACWWIFKDDYKLKSYVNITSKHEQNNVSLSAFQNKSKHILIWTNPNTTPFLYLGTGNSQFIKKNCTWKNCYITSDANYLGDITKFDVIAFNGPELIEMVTYKRIPQKRSQLQKYVYANIESSANYPICTDIWNEFFNWTWTYKLNSDAMWGYFVIRNSSNHVIGPGKEMNWLSPHQMDDIDNDLKLQLTSKSRAVAWFASNCMTSSLREKYIFQLQKKLKKYSLMIHVYGKCGEYDCPIELMPRCLNMLEDTYYFYLAFENAISEDYVTEKVMNALNHNTVPIVYGGANYTSFLPSGSYLNAAEFSPAELALKIYQILKSPTEYYNFFKWKKYYSYHFRYESPETDDYCNFCGMLNDEKLMRTTTIYDDFNVWWTGANFSSICHPVIELLEIG